jgi:hypothetical protein
MARGAVPSSGTRLAAILFGLAMALALGVLSQLALRRPIWYDELFTYYVSSLPSASAVLDALLDGADNGPPIDYLLRHFSLRFGGGGALALRLPSLISMAAMMLCLWAFLRRRVGGSAAIAGATLPLGTLAAYYAVEGRAYAPLLAAAAASLLAWQRAQSSVRARLFLVALLAVAPLVHYFGVLNVLPVLAGELALWRKRRRPQATLWFVLASQLSLLLLPPFARHAMAMREAFWASSYDGWTPWFTYGRLLGPLLWPLVALLAFLAVDRMRDRPAAQRSDVNSGLRQHELIAALTLALVPFFVLGLASLLTHAMTYRYSLAAVLGLAVLTAEAVDRLGKRRRGVGGTIALGLCLLVGLSLHSFWQRESLRGAQPPELTELLGRREAPLAIESPRTFLELYARTGPQARQRWLYLSDRELARRHLGYDNDEIALSNLRHIVPLNLIPYRKFMNEHVEFDLLVDREPSWLRMQLQADGARLDSLRRIGDRLLLRVALGTSGDGG